MPYGVDLIVPNNFVGKGENLSDEDMLGKIPQSHKDFAHNILENNGIDVDPNELEEDRKNHLRFGKNMTPEGAHESLTVAFNHPIKMIVNALGMPPKQMVDMAKDAGVKVKLYGIYISQPAGMAAMEKNLLFNDVIVVKEFNPTNPDAPEWYKNYEKGQVEKMGLTPDADRFRFMFEMFKNAIEITNSFEPKDIAYALEG